MKIYDISQEVFTCSVYPGDPSPQREEISSIKNGDLYNLTAFSMCAHNGTHIDAPYHFLRNGKTVEAMSIEKTVGYAFVFEVSGDICAADARDIVQKAKSVNAEAAKRILLKGSLTVSNEAAREFVRAGVELIGDESQTVGPEDSPAEVHKILLGADLALLEGIRLQNVPEGVYLLCAAPILLGGADGAPCRAILIEI